MRYNESLCKYHTHINANGSLSLPEEFTETLTGKDNTIYITNAALDKCLRVYHGYEWEQINHKVANLSLLEEKEKYFIRRVIASAQTTKVNRLGRIVLSRNSMEDAGIQPDSEVVIVGEPDKFELWSRNEWTAATNHTNIDHQSFNKQQGD